MPDSLQHSPPAPADSASECAERADWAELARAALGGRSPDTLTRTSLDGIEQPPIAFSGEAPEPVTYPGEAPFLRGAAAGANRAGWEVRPRVEIGDPEQARALLLDELEGGATAVELALRRDPAERLQPLLERALDGVWIEAIPIVLDGGLDPATPLDALLAVARARGLEPTDLRLTICADPLGELARRGLVADRWEPYADEARALVRHVRAAVPGATTFRVATAPYHDAGAGDAQELAIAIATVVEYLRLMERAGLGVGEALGQIRIALTLDTDLFGGLAKMRAMRLLWARIGDVLAERGDRNTRDEASAPLLEATVARRCLSRRDPWVNVLRSVAAAWVAVTGGAETLTVPAYDQPAGQPSDRGRRLARNTQLILRDEAHLHRVIDPAGGAWLIEQATERLAARSWALFQELEREGGLAASLASGRIQSRIAEVAARRAERVARRRDGIVGVSEYANLAESPPSGPAPEPLDGSGEAAPQALPLRRLAAPFEELRDRSDRALLARGARPRVFLATLGSAAQFNARANFTRNLLAAGGLETVAPPLPPAGAALAPAEIAASFSSSETGVAILCSSDEAYAESAAAAVRALREAGATLILLAGRPRELMAELEAAGLDGAFAAGDDVLELLERIWSSLDEPAGDTGLEGSES